MDPLPFLGEFVGNLLVAREETTVSSEKPQGAMGRLVADHEVSNSLIIVQIFSADLTLELNPQDYFLDYARSTRTSIKEKQAFKFQGTTIPMSAEKIVIKTKHGELSLEQLAEAQHGMAHLMKEVGDRYHVLFYAAQARSWKLAQYQLKQIIALFNTGSTLRPKYAADLNGFVKTHFQPMNEALLAQDWKRFEETYQKAIKDSDQLHEKYGYGYIRFVVPKNPPEMYDLSPDK